MEGGGRRGKGRERGREGERKVQGGYGQDRKGGEGEGR